MLTNDDRADLGLAAMMHGDPDYGADADTTDALITSAGDAISNILHAVARATDDGTSRAAMHRQRATFAAICGRAITYTVDELAELPAA